MITPELVDYIKKQKALGQTESQIISTLTSNGWLASDVDEAFKQINLTQTIQVSPITPVPSIAPTASPAMNPVLNTVEIPLSSIASPMNYQKPEVKIIPKKSHKGLIAVVVIILFLSAGGASAYYFKDNIKTWPIVRNFFPQTDVTLVPADNQPTPEESTIVVSEQKDSEVTPAENNIVFPANPLINADWQTYKNTQFAFEFKHPKEFRVEEIQSTDILHLSVISDWKTKDEYGIEKFLSFPFIVRKYLDVNQNSQDTLETTCQKYKEAEKTEGKLIECREVSINGIPFIKVVQQLKNNIGITLTAASGPYYFIGIPLVANDQNQGDHLKVIDALFATIKINIK